MTTFFIIALIVAAWLFIIFCAWAVVRVGAMADERDRNIRWDDNNESE